jgi:hypothetical protein
MSLLAGACAGLAEHPLRSSWVGGSLLGTSVDRESVAAWASSRRHWRWPRPATDVVRVGPEVWQRCHLQARCHRAGPAWGRRPGPGAAPEAAEARSPAAHSTKALKWPGGLRAESGGGCQSGNGELRGQFYSSLTPVSLSKQLRAVAGSWRRVAYLLVSQLGLKPRPAWQRVELDRTTGLVRATS